MRENAAPNWKHTKVDSIDGEKVVIALEASRLRRRSVARGHHR